ncbi:hypothetical protein PACTADRAFT_22882, partial [Pachysolen tannophilus NRRL Y-2460]
EIVNVDFDYFNLNPDIDFHSIKNLLRQLFGEDSKEFDLSSLTDLILNNNIGTTVKTDGEQSDPFSVLSVLNLTKELSEGNKNDNKFLKKIVDYVISKTSKKTEFNLMLRKLLLSNDSKKIQTGLIISERLINMPVETVPPMYKMLLEESAKEDDYKDLKYFLVITKVYQLVSPQNPEDEEDENDNGRKSKRSKKSSDVSNQTEMDYFHYEDSILEDNSNYHSYFPYTHKTRESDSRRVFNDYGIEPKLSLILIDKSKLEKSVTEMFEKFPPF